MNHKDFPDIQEILDNVFSAAEEIREAFANEMGFGPGAKGAHLHWSMYRDFYPAYAYPPLNVYLTADKSMVFQFALAGFGEKDVTLAFKGDYLSFSAKLGLGHEAPADVRYFKHRLKLKDIPEQKYYVPAARFNQEAVSATMRNGILTVTIPPAEAPQEAPGKTINIVREETGTP